MSEQDHDVIVLNDNNRQEANAHLQLHDEPPHDAVQTVDDGVRVRACKFFLTFPQCEYSHVDALENLVMKFGDGIKWCVVSRELHSDGHHHLHVALYLKERFSYQANGHTWDFVAEQHGNYQKMRKQHECVKYVIKDGVYVSYPEDFNPEVFVVAGSKRKSVQSELVAVKILSGERDLMKLAHEHAGFILRNLHHVQNFVNLVATSEASQIQLKSLDGLSTEGLRPKVGLIGQWLKSVLERKESDDRKWLHLRIEGPTAIGKSTLCFVLRQFLRIYQMPYETSFYCNFTDEDFDLVLLDEFRSQVKPTFLNEFSDGLGIQLRRKGKPVLSHQVKTPCIILSNYTWEECYTNLAENNPSVLDACKRRFITVRLEQDDLLFPLIERIKNLE